MVLPACSAAAVASDLTQAATITPCSQLKASNTNGTPEKQSHPKLQVRGVVFFNSSIKTYAVATLKNCSVKASTLNIRFIWEKWEIFPLSFQLFWLALVAGIFHLNYFFTYLFIYSYLWVIICIFVCCEGVCRRNLLQSIPTIQTDSFACKTKVSLLTHRSSSTEEESADRYTFRVFPFWMNDWTLACWSCEPRVGMGSLALSLFAKLPWLVKPVSAADSLKFIMSKTDNDVIIIIV